MRTMLSPVAPFTAAVLLAAAQQAIAQQAPAPNHPRPVIQHAAVTVTPVLRTVAIYRFRAWRDARMPGQVTVADSAGELVASFQLPGDPTAHPMTVALVDTDLVLQGETPSGLLTLRLYRQNDSEAAGAIAGRWWLGEQQGELRGRVVR